MWHISPMRRTKIDSGFEVGLRSLICAARDGRSRFLKLQQQPNKHVEATRGYRAIYLNAQEPAEEESEQSKRSRTRIHWMSRAMHVAEAFKLDLPKYTEQTDTEAAADSFISKAGISDALLSTYQISPLVLYTVSDPNVLKRLSLNVGLDILNEIRRLFPSPSCHLKLLGMRPKFDALVSSAPDSLYEAVSLVARCLLKDLEEIRMAYRLPLNAISRLASEAKNESKSRIYDKKERRYRAEDDMQLKTAVQAYAEDIACYTKWISAGLYLGSARAGLEGHLVQVGLSGDKSVDLTPIKEFLLENCSSQAAYLGLIMNNEQQQQQQQQTSQEDARLDFKMDFEKLIRFLEHERICPDMALFLEDPAVARFQDHVDYHMIYSTKLPELYTMWAGVCDVLIRRLFKQMVLDEAFKQKVYLFEASLSLLKSFQQESRQSLPEETALKEEEEDIDNAGIDIDNAGGGDGFLCKISAEGGVSASPFDNTEKGDLLFAMQSFLYTMVQLHKNLSGLDIHQLSRLAGDGNDTFISELCLRHSDSQQQHAVYLSTPRASLQACGCAKVHLDACLSMNNIIAERIMAEKDRHAQRSLNATME